MGLIEHARRELTAVGYDMNDTEEGLNKWMVESVLELIQTFANQGHSGFSAPYCIDLFEKLARYEPLGPLTGEDSEWQEVSAFPKIEQNLRCSHVFRENGEAYDIDGIIFRDPKTKATYTSFESRVSVTFPYTPKSVIVDRLPDREEPEVE